MSAIVKFAITSNREQKFLTIQRVLSDFLGAEVKENHILDIGTGNGEIAEYFAKNNEVCAVDVFDQRKNKTGKVKFSLIKGTALPFDAETFDIVLSNHVGEHTPDWNEHLNEIKRVLKPRGICYLASPNRLFPWEGHYNVWFIHYLPRTLFFSLLKTMGIYQEDVKLLTWFQLKRMLKKKFFFKEYTQEIIKYQDRYYMKIPVVGKFPMFAIRALRFLSQANMFVLKKK
ncbi:class I SAM-dependent methyltransferase [Desulforhopalus vacuolatus]|uniref:class I SAM-dependent methyltransferase n=1 Tax=Desulforhopalus vacuolatus TaxID=40414 RepID=UPI001964451B|nr:class I SAM-dependent methyltransferase [Desulforhopalus vacuolatus]MBM9520031.1 class I SAM-dependent methyltransferase [Desulforhopalus vacuolatus]